MHKKFAARRGGETVFERLSQMFSQAKHAKTQPHFPVAAQAAREMAIDRVK